MVRKIDCFIPCRKNGDFLKNLNFLEIDQLKLVEHTINCSINSGLFRNIYILTNDKKSFLSLKKKYSILKLIYIKSNKLPFYEIINNLSKKKYFEKKIDICVLLPNYPFKSDLTIKKIYKKYKLNNLNFLTSAKKDNFFYYVKKRKKIESINFSTKIKSRKDIPPIYKLSGGIFLYNSDKKKLNLKQIHLKNIYFLNHHESFGIYSLYDIITASSLFNIDKSILLKMAR
jgi:CMP-N-acetylneuraminic acid synthetase